MEIINILEIVNGIPNQIISYVVDEINEKVSVDVAESTFKKLLKENDSSLTDEDMENFIEDGYTDRNGYELSIIWSTFV